MHGSLVTGTVIGDTRDDCPMSLTCRSFRRLDLFRTRSPEDNEAIACCRLDGGPVDRGSSGMMPRDSCSRWSESWFGGSGVFLRGTEVSGQKFWQSRQPPAGECTLAFDGRLDIERTRRESTGVGGGIA